MDDLTEAPAAEWVDDGSLPVDNEGALHFFFLDAHEEIHAPGVVYLFGKVSTFDAHVSKVFSPTLTLQHMLWLLISDVEEFNHGLQIRGVICGSQQPFPPPQHMNPFILRSKMYC